MKIKLSRNNKITLYLLIILFVLIGVAIGIIDKEELYKYLNTQVNTQEVNTNTTIQNTDELYNVVRVVDGDTFVISYNGKEEKVRLIGIDTPESVHANASKNTEEGKLASDYTKELLTGKKVKLEFDVEKKDKYGRFLAYVYLDDKMVNKLLLEEGYAKIATYPPNVKYVEDFKQIQKQARENKKGFWDSLWK